VIGVLSTYYAAAHTFSPSELRTLDLYAQQAADFVDRWQAVDDLRKSEQRLRKSLLEKDALLTEIHHRVKNNLQVIISLLNLQARKVQDKEAQAFFKETRNRVHSIASIHEILYSSEDFAAVNFGEYIRRLVPDVIALYGANDRITTRINSDGVVLDMQRAVPLGLLLNELVSNVCKHAFAEGASGEMTVDLAWQDSSIALKVSDTGVGLPRDFDKNGSALGLSLVQDLARQLEATVAFASEPRQGTTVDVRLPLVSPNGSGKPARLETHRKKVKR
jgi:two-component sensor histidine kinase